MSDPAPTPSDAPFQALYRRFRPQRFSEVLGQGHVTLALRNAVRDAHVAHAYLFSGPRGTGKTSTARILGKALNCVAVVDGEPCGICVSCTSIAAGNSFDVHELDAASNNGVDAMRDLVSRASLATPGRWKVYIVDEVHMLSTAASNALLKTLEEPPDHVVFVLATTDPQKVLPTIRSRTQHYEFHLLADDVLAGLVEEVAAGAGLSLPEGAAVQAVRRGRGSARDTLSILDQVAAAGVVDDDDGALMTVISALANEDGGAALVALDAVARSGRDPQQIAVELIEVLRTGFLSLAGATSMAGSAARIFETDLEMVRSLGLVRCVRAMELLGLALVAMRDAPEPRITLDVAIYRSAALDAETSTDALLERIERLERRLDDSIRPAAATPPPPLPNVATGRSVPRSDEPTGPATPERTEDGSPRRTGAQTVAPTTMPTEPISDDSPPLVRPALGAFRPRAGAPIPPPATVDWPPMPPDSTSIGATSDASPPAPEPPEPSAADTSTDRDAAPAHADPDRDAHPDPDPDRDAFVAAWGDAVLPKLRLKVRALYQVGRFVSARDGIGEFALPNEFHVQMAMEVRDEVASALSAHFGRRVDVRLVVDRPTSGQDARVSTVAPAPRPDAPPAAESVDDEELGETDDVGEPIDDPVELERASQAGAEWATRRIREAFPGAEEITT